MPVTTSTAWQQSARPHQLELLEQFVYGRRLPAVPVTVVGKVDRVECTLAGDVAAVRVQATLKLGGSLARFRNVWIKRLDAP